MNKSIKFFIACALVLGFQVPAFAQSSFEEVIVTAQRTEQSLQDVPIAVTALTSDDLDSKQIITFSDLQLNVPGLNFTQTNFGGSSINLRGIGRLSTGTSFDQSVSYHVNDAPVGNTGIGLEQYDVARVEVLRGPQGTLFGRGATAGAVNTITNKAELGEAYGKLKTTVGNYNTQKIEAVANMPITENMAVRFAGYDLQLDGFVDNLFLPNEDYDGRDQTSGRFSFTWENDATTINAMFENYNEESTRGLKGRYVCKNSPVPSRGCVFGNGGSGAPSDLANPAAVYDGIIAAVMLKIAPPAANVDTYKALGLLKDNEIRPANMTARQTHADFTPIWKRDTEVTQFAISHDIDAGQFAFNYTGFDYRTYDRSDTDMAVNPAIAALSGGTYVRADLSPAFTGIALMDTCVGSWCDAGYGPNKAEEMTGKASDLAKYTLVNAKRGTFIDGTTLEGADDYYELKFVSDFDGPHNFLLGINSYEIDVQSRYATISSPLTMLAPAASYYPAVFGTLSRYELEAEGIFGEYYYQINDDMKLTVGARFADETKTSNDYRTTYNMGTNYNGGPYAALYGATGQATKGWAADEVKLIHASITSCLEWSPAGGFNATGSNNSCNTSALESIAVAGVTDLSTINTLTGAAAQAFGTAFAGATGTLTERGTAATIASAAEAVALIDYLATNVPAMYVESENYKKPVWPAFGQNSFDYETTSGRVVFDWQYNENSMMYVSYARGVKPAGVNPAANPRIYVPCYAGAWGAAGDPATCVDIPAQTKKEVADTFEIGVKTDLLGGQIRLNANAFVTDYADLQIASVIAATTYNFNSDADISGAELELTYLPEWDSNLRIDFMLSLLDTEITSNDSKLNPFNKLATGLAEDISDTHVEVKCTALLYDSQAACVGNTFVVKKTDIAKAVADGEYANSATAATGNTPLAALGGLTASQAAFMTDLGTFNANGTIATYPAYGDRNVYDVAGTGNLMGITTSNGATINIKGNQLPQSPEESMNLGVSYTFSLNNGMTLIPNFNYYYQGEQYSTEFNSDLTDLIESWDEINLGLLLIPAQGDWTLKAYARNVTDEENVTSKYNSTDITGNFQSWQYRDPRTVGLELTMDF